MPTRRSSRRLKTLANSNKKTSANTSGVLADTTNFKANGNKATLDEKLGSKPKGRRKSRRKNKQKKQGRDGVVDDESKIDGKSNKESVGQESTIDQDRTLSRRMSRRMSAPPTPGFTPLRPSRLSFTNTCNSPSFYSP